ncbi:MAG: 30S ribosomal protein S1 [Desulfobacterales bacterium]|jgi:small subunit ribosomal protein S1|nr:30S ribosomal protein S1 [Desulfobacterales bacterium]
MTEQTEPSTEESFAALLDAYSVEKSVEVRIGDRVKGRIVSIGKDTVFVDTGTKIDAVVDKAELLDAEGRLGLSEGDELELYVAAVGENEIRLSRAVSGAGGAQALREAYQKKAPVEGKVKEPCKGGFIVDIMQRRAFCPISQIDIVPVQDPASHVGATYQFLVTRFEDKGRNIVVSRRSLLSRELEAQKKKFMESLKSGDVLDGKVTRLMPYGAFVALAPGVEGMVHVSEISYSRTALPEEVLSPGDRVRVKVLGIEPAAGEKPAKIGLSIRQLEEDPWLSAEEKLRPGDVVKGRVTRCMNFGAFVEIAPGLEGLIHISEMSYTRRVMKVEELLTAGDTVTVSVKAVDLEKRRIALSLKEAEGDPWAEAIERFPAGKRVEGVVEKREKFGIFVRLAPGITGLLPLGAIRRSAAAAALEKLREGETVLVAVEEVNVPKRRISLVPANAGEEGDWQSFSPSTKGSFGALAEKLQSALAGRRQ